MAKMNKVYVITHATYGLGGVFTSEVDAEEESKMMPCYDGFAWMVKEIKLNERIY